MKAKTKKRVIHVLTKKKLVKRKTSKHVLRSFFIAIATISMGSLAYGITLNKPTVGVAVHHSNAGGVKIAAPVIAGPPTPMPINGAPAMVGRGSWYALGLPQPDAHTCASTKYPRGTYIHVTNLYNKKTVICRVNDYGPEAWTNRVIDLSRGSFSAVENLGRGTIPVELRIVAGPTGYFPTEELGTIIGYAECKGSHDGQYCEAHRQTTE